MIEIVDQNKIRITCDVCEFETIKEIAFEISNEFKIVKPYSESLHACQDCIDSGKAEAYRRGYETAKKEYPKEN